MGPFQSMCLLCWPCRRAAAGCWGSFKVGARQPVCAMAASPVSEETPAGAAVAFMDVCLHETQPDSPETVPTAAGATGARRAGAGGPSAGPAVPGSALAPAPEGFEQRALIRFAAAKGVDLKDVSLEDVSASRGPRSCGHSCGGNGQWCAASLACPA